MAGTKASQFVEVGQVFGYWTVVSDKVVRSNNRRAVMVECSCRNQSLISISSLYSGQSTSCLKCVQSRRREIETDGYSDVWKAGHVARVYFRNAESRSLSWLLTDEQVADIIFKPCHYCGGNPSNTLRQKGYRQFEYNGIDRVDNLKGYESGNCVPCCKKCNFGKRDMSAEDYLSHCLRVVEFNS